MLGSGREFWGQIRGGKASIGYRREIRKGAMSQGCHDTVGDPSCVHRQVRKPWKDSEVARSGLATRLSHALRDDRTYPPLRPWPSFETLASLAPHDEAELMADAAGPPAPTSS